MAHTDNHLPLSALLAALVTAAKNDIRYYLNTVHIEANGSGKAVVVGCNGHTLLAVITEVPWTLPTLHVPRDTVEQLGKLKPTWVEFTATDEPKVYNAKAGSSVLRFADVEASYPGWQAVVPRDTQPGGAAVALEYMVAAANVAKALKPELAKRPAINVSTNGDNRAVTLSFGTLRDDSPVANTIMVIMPMRGYSEPRL